MNPWSRRAFAKIIVLASATTALSASRVLGANDRVRLGFIGLGNRGDQVLDAFLKQSDAEVVAICDLYQPYLDYAARKIGTQPRQMSRGDLALSRRHPGDIFAIQRDRWPMECPGL